MLNVIKQENLNQASWIHTLEIGKHNSPLYREV